MCKELRSGIEPAASRRTVTFEAPNIEVYLYLYPRAVLAGLSRPVVVASPPPPSC